MRSPRSSSLSRLFVPLGLTILLAPLLLSPAAQANEGQWKPGQVAEIHERAKAAGLELSPAQLWMPGGQPGGPAGSSGLLRAAVNIGGCTAAFISAEGLLSTNHHCAYGSLQANSSVEHNYLADGFLAAARTDELPAPGKTVRILDEITDVSDQIAAKLAGIEDDGARARA